MSDGISKAATELHDLSAVQLLNGYNAKTFSPSDVLEDVLNHVAKWEPHIQALYAFDPDGARVVAKASTERWQHSAPQGPLDGVPVTIKDNIATKGVPVPSARSRRLWCRPPPMPRPPHGSAKPAR